MTEQHSDRPRSSPDADRSPIPSPPKASRKELQVVPDDSELIEQEMAELFEEDRVTHQHGSAEPEGE
ncbi:MAG: hypothetical protein D6690_03335 [Nitrospirae bacterium]|nr:MAG: hypothetical protein D6690_03335 [Nitrospirota bacterium]